MRKILIIGIGAGDPDHLTIQAVKALHRVDVFFIPNKGAEKAELRTLRTEICERHIDGRDYRMVDVAIPSRAPAGSDYRGSVDDWHARLAEIYAGRFLAELAEGQCGGLLVWGDPALYDSTLRIIETIRAGGLAIDYEVVPGISSVQVLAAQHRITLNQIGKPVLITTGRRLAQGFPEGQDSVVVMLDGEQSFRQVMAADLDIYWGAYLGTPDEILLSGRLAEMADEIERVRAQARKDKGWIMDTYLLRKPEPR
jgi:precorrin-6A synthase